MQIIQFNTKIKKNVSIIVDFYFSVEQNRYIYVFDSNDNVWIGQFAKRFAFQLHLHFGQLTFGTFDLFDMNYTDYLQTKTHNLLCFQDHNTCMTDLKTISICFLQKKLHEIEKKNFGKISKKKHNFFKVKILSLKVNFWLLIESRDWVSGLKN